MSLRAIDIDTTKRASTRSGSKTSGIESPADWSSDMDRRYTGGRNRSARDNRSRVAPRPKPRSPGLNFRPSYGLSGVLVSEASVIAGARFVPRSDARIVQQYPLAG